MGKATAEVTMPLDLFKAKVDAAHIAGLKEALEIARKAPEWSLPGATRRIAERISEMEAKKS